MSEKNNPAKDYMGWESVITRDFDAPRDVVFNAWIDPKHLVHWWGPKGFTNPVCEADARPGGAIYIVMRAPNGVDYPMRGEFREIVAPERLVFTSGALDANGNLIFELLQTVTFHDQGEKSSLTVTARVIKATAEAAKYLGGHKAGMTQSLERLAQLASDSSDRQILISRDFDAPRELVWQAMTDANHVIHWWGPRGFSTTIEQMDVRPGGAWNLTMIGPDGARYPNRSVFTEVTPPQRIVFEHGGSREGGGPAADFVATWTFDEPAPGKTKVTIRMVFASQAERDVVVKEYGAIEGGKQTLERLGEHLVKMRA